jgi:hypothetical protein
MMRMTGDGLSCSCLRAGLRRVSDVLLLLEEGGS